MTIPFLQFFKRGKVNAEEAKKRAQPAPPPLEKPSSERFSKTVMPNATRTVPPQDQLQVGTGADGTDGQRAVAAPGPEAARTISFGAKPAPSKAQLPRAVALALEPNVERVIWLELADILPQLPPDCVKAIEGDETKRRVLLKASEVEKGMASGRPSVSIASIYGQIPEIFLKSIAPGDPAQVQLPFAKVLAQFSQLQVRADQLRDEAVPHVETPFLKVTLEDSDKFGVPLLVQALGNSELPPVRMELATAETFAAAEPEAAACARYVVPSTPPPERETNGHCDLPVSPVTTNGSTAAPPGKSAPTRIPFTITPNGTDVPASERVPASRGSSVPTSLPAAPTRIPFKVTAPCDDLRAQFAVLSSPAAPATPEKKSEAEGIRIQLPLRLILQNLPPLQLHGDPATIPAGARIELPFSIVEPQLATGRIAIAPEIFAAALPETHRHIFNAETVGLDVSLPLQEVLKNLPSTLLQMRADQVEQELGTQFATPFSAKAEEDAERFRAAAATIAKPPEERVAVPDAAPVAFAVVNPNGASERASKPLAATEEKPLETPKRTALQEALDSDEDLDAKTVVAGVDRIEGVKACALLFGDGLSLAGTLPPELETEGLCAMAPSLLQRVENHMVDTKLGKLHAMTITCTESTITFFMHDNLCLAALHANGELAPGVRDRLSTVVRELSRKYSQAS